jgi:hypothetical protein
VKVAAMPITYTISRNERMIRAAATGVISADDLNSFVNAVLADPAMKPGLRALYDASEAEPDISILQLAEVAGRVLKLVNRGLGRIAIVAQSRATYRVAKTFSILARAIGIEVEVFEEHHAAEAWLVDSRGDSDTQETPVPPLPS